MPPSEIGDQGYAVLTVLGLLGHASAYDIERFLERLAGEFWSVPHTQVYRECAQLAAAKLVTERQEKGGRRRRVYALTKNGRDTLRAWVRAPTERTIEIRDVASVKLLASELSTTDDIRALARAQVADYDRRLARLEEIEARYRDPALASRMQSVPLGRSIYEAARAFWADIAENPPVID